jgi:hypothetical protein
MTVTDTSEDCCTICIHTPGCLRWVWSPDDKTGGDVKHCWLKNGESHPPVARAGRISGVNPNVSPTPKPAAPTPPPPLPPVTEWSKKYRNWHYYTTGGPYGGFVVPPKPLLTTPSGDPVVVVKDSSSSGLLCGLGNETYNGRHR